MIIESPAYAYAELYQEKRDFRRATFEVLDARFQYPSTELADAMEKIESFPTLRELHRFAAVCPSVEVFKQKLATLSN